jgi:hypothetical protein
MTGATAFINATTGGELNHARRQDFLALYPNRHKSILKDASRNSDWVTLSRHAPLTDAQLLNALSLKENFLRGCRWGEQTKFAVLDIDKNSQLHNELGLARLKHSLAVVGFDKPLLFQSSESGGWHLYLSLSSWTRCVEVQETLRAWLVTEGYEIRQGQLEIFPSNNGLRLPLQKGFGWLDEHAELKLNREELTTDQAISTFLSALDESVHSWATVKTKIERRLQEPTTIAPPPAEEQEDGFSSFFTHAGMIQEVYDAGRIYWQNGLTKQGQRHHAILCVGHYLWYGDEQAGVRALPGIRQAEKRAAAIEAWLRQNHNGHSQTILKGDWNQILSDIGSACHWTSQEGMERPRESYAITDRAIDRLVSLTKQTGRVWSPEDFEKANIRREERAREQIRSALNKLIEEGHKITIRGLERLSGCRRETIRRHSDIWGALRLSKGLGDLRSPYLVVVPDLPVLEVESDVVVKEDSLCLASSSQPPVPTARFFSMDALDINQTATVEKEQCFNFESSQLNSLNFGAHALTCFSTEKRTVMKNILVLGMLAVIGLGTPTVFAADNVEKLEKAAEKNEHKADKQEHKAEIDEAENKMHGTEKHARKAALDEIKSEKEEQRVQVDKNKSAANP